MASAFQDRRGWIADFLPLGGTGKTRRRVRVPANYLHGDPKAAATAYASECDRYCRLLEINPYDAHTIDHALQIGAITQEQAAALLGFQPVQLIAERGPDPLTILDAALQHPSTVYESEHSQRDYLRHRRELDEYLQFAAVKYVSEISLINVQGYIRWLKAQGHKRAGIEHRLRLIKRAARIGTTVGIADPLAGWRLIRSEPAERIDTWSLDELRWLAKSLDEPRMQAVVYLGGFMGLRSSEIIRLQADDLRGDVLHVGEHGAKNEQSRRSLPVPGIIRERLESLGQHGDDPLIRATRFNRHYDPFGLDHWLRPHIAKPPKMLRKAFSTWGVSYLPPRHVETFLGHVSGLVSNVTARHYLADVRLEELRPTADIIHRIISGN